MRNRCTPRTGHGPENIAALRRFAIGAIKSQPRDTLAATIQRLARNVRLVFDDLSMTDNSHSGLRFLQAQPGENGFAVVQRGRGACWRGFGLGAAGIMRCFRRSNRPLRGAGSWYRRLY